MIDVRSLGQAIFGFGDRKSEKSTIANKTQSVYCKYCQWMPDFMPFFLKEKYSWQSHLFVYHFYTYIYIYIYLTFIAALFFCLFVCLFYYYYYFYFTILYWFCHTSTWICHGSTRVPHPEPLSHLPPHIIPLGHPSAPAPSFLYPASNLDWRFISYTILYMF